MYLGTFICGDIKCRVFGDGSMDRLGDCLWGVLGGVVDTIHWLSDFLVCYFQIGFQYFATVDILEKDL